MMLARNFHTNVFNGLIGLILLSLGVACQSIEPTTYGEMVNTFRESTEIFELVSPNGHARVAIAPALQGKVLSSTYGGQTGSWNGWLDIKAWCDNPSPQTNVGGEDRLWIGPLGGQHSFYYQQIKPLHEDNWQVPTPLKTGAYQVTRHSAHEIVMQQQMRLTNYMGTKLDMCVIRRVRMIDQPTLESNLGIHLDKACRFVAFESFHQLINTGRVTWEKETGLAGLWSLNMIRGSDQTWVYIPLDSSASSHQIFQYLGPLTKDRFQVKEKEVYFLADGKYRSKIGIPANIAPSLFGCYSPENQRLTIVQYSKERDGLYFNSEVSIQENPYIGEAIAIYNHGRMDYQPMADNQFFELESISAMRPLTPGDSLYHVHRVYHFSGSADLLKTLSQQLLGIDLVKAST